MIPQLIHQTWSTADLPQQSEALTRRWKQLHPEYEYRLWTDAECREFVRTEYPGFYSTYQAFPSEIQRVDAVRYLILNKYGGIYLDLDMFPLRKLDALTSSTDFIVSFEPAEAATKHAREFIISNAFMATPPRHPFLAKLIEEMQAYQSTAKNGNERILDTTGPFLLSRVYGKHPQGVRVLHSQYFMPLFFEQVDALVSQRNGDEFYCRCHDAYGVHLFEGSWWRKKAPASYTDALVMPAKSSKIPRVIHQTWKTKELPAQFAPLVARVRELHPDWEVRLWTDDEMSAFIAEHGPQYLPKYASYKHAIQRCDFFRLFVVSILGGVYLDLDIRLEKSFDELPGYMQAFFPCEKVMSKNALIACGNRDAVRIGNYAFGAEPNHPFLHYMLERLNKTTFIQKWRRWNRDDVVETTGPGFLTTAYHDYAKQSPQSNVAILYPEMGASVGCDCGSYAGVAACKIGSFGTHLHVGTWRGSVPTPTRWSWLTRLTSTKRTTERSQPSSAATSTPALVSCLCITRDRVPLLRRAITCFLEQAYEPRELVVVYESEDVATRDYLRTLADPRIRAVEVPSSSRMPLGTLRNLAVESARGQYVAQWDDDDWYAPNRLSEQMKAIRESGRAGCVLSRWTIHDTPTQQSYISGSRTWEGSIVVERTAIPPYPAAAQGEDAPVITAMMKKKQLTLLERPDLYIYVFHGLNTWNRQHWLALIKNAKRLGRQDEERVSRTLAIDVPAKVAA